MEIKKILLGLVIIFVLFVGINTVAALNSSVLDAISGLPLSDQILIIAKEVDRLKLKDELRDACDKADELFYRYKTPQNHFVGIASLDLYINAHKESLAYYESGKGDYQFYDGTEEEFQRRKNEHIQKLRTELAELEEQYSLYLTVKADCDRLTEEFNQKYGE